MKAMMASAQGVNVAHSRHSRQTMTVSLFWRFSRAGVRLHLASPTVYFAFDTLAEGAMQTVIDLFERHPASVGESYFEHMLSALDFSGRMVGAAATCVIHAFFPFVFITTASNEVRRLHERMIENRRRVSGAAWRPPEPDYCI